MAPKPKPVPPRLGPPPQLSQYRVPTVQQKRIEPKMREILGRQGKLVAKWVHLHMTWKKILLSWMVLLAASKMVLLMLTYEFFTMTALISLQIFHGVWTIAFFCLNVIESRAILPNASCLLAAYLPATTVLHILLIPNNYPLEFIITDAVGTFLAIITMFLLLRMECTEILHEAEELWERNGPNGSNTSDTSSESGYSCSGRSTTSTASTSNRSTTTAGSAATTARMSSAGNNSGSEERLFAPNSPHGGRTILGNPHGPTVISVNGNAFQHAFDYPQVQHREQLAQQHGGGPLVFNHHHNNQQQALFNQQYFRPIGVTGGELDKEGGAIHAQDVLRSQNNVILDNVLFEEPSGLVEDLEPIDFEHFVDQDDDVDADDAGRSAGERMFRVTFGESPPGRGR